TYVREPPFFADLAPTPVEPSDIAGARCLVKLGDSITTDHISPAGSIKPDSPAGRYLLDHGVEQRDFNSLGARCLVKLGDSITTDHISPAGSIKPDSPAGRYLLDHGVEQRDFNSYGAR